MADDNQTPIAGFSGENAKIFWEDDVRSSVSSMLLVCTAAIAWVPFSASAQQAGDSGDEQAAVRTDEIVVTAQKRSERLSDVPLSVSAASGEQLAKAGVASPADLGKIVPGFTYQPSNYGPPVFSVRGIGFFDNSLAASPTVSVYIDQVPLPFLAMTPGAALDLERVEVLKGPQGTLFGQNSTGGAINFIAAKPTKQWSFGGSAEYARFDQVNVGGFVSGPLSDKLGVRLAVRTEQGGAWQKSATRPGDRLGDRDFTTGRLILDWTPDDVAHLQFSASGWIDKSETTAAQYVRYVPTRPGGYTDQEAALLAAPLAPRNNRIADWDPNTDLSQDSKFYQLALNGEFNLSDAVTLTTITAYSHLKVVNPVDADGTDFNNFLVTTFGKIDAFSQEARLAGQLNDGKLKWMIGGNYNYSDTRDLSLLTFIASNAGVGPLRYRDVYNISNVTNEAASVFGSLDYQLTDTILAQVSARYTDQKQMGHGCLADTGDGALAAAFGQLSATPIPAGQCVTFVSSVPPGPPPFTPVGGLVRIPLNENNVSWRANLSWKPNRDVHVYANITKGYKSGSFSRLPVVFSSQYNPVPQESVLAYEAGVKLSLLNRTMEFSGSAFYYDYTDKQILGYVLTSFGNLPGLVTVPKSRVAGGEMNLNWRPISGLTLNGGVTFVDSKVRSSFITKDPFAADINIKGSAFPITPKWQLSGDAEYEFPLSGALNAYLGANATYRSSSASTFGGGDEFILPAYTLVDLRAGVEGGNRRWRAEIWGRNVFNTFYTVNASHVADTVARVTGKPATYGVTLSFHF